MYEKIISRLKNLIVMGLLNAVDDSNEVQLLKLETLAGVVADKVERVQNYGVTSNPPEGGEAIVVNVGGNSDHPVVIALDGGKYRKKDLKPGEVAVYDKNGSYILLREDGSIEVKAVKDYIINSETVKLGGDTLSPLAGVVTGECLDPVTGVPFPDKSAVVFAKK